MTEIFSVIIFSIIILFIEIYSETHLKNYGRFIERIVYLLSIKTLFNLLKFSVLFGFGYVLLNLNDNQFLQLTNLPDEQSSDKSSDQARRLAGDDHAVLASGIR